MISAKLKIQCVLIDLAREEVSSSWNAVCDGTQKRSGFHITLYTETGGA